MITNQLALVRRELWEHRSIFVTPAAVALVMSLIVLTAYVAASGFGEAHTPSVADLFVAKVKGASA